VLGIILGAVFFADDADAASAAAWAAAAGVGLGLTRWS
jgi:hypothetical protein